MIHLTDDELDAMAIKMASKIPELYCDGFHQENNLTDEEIKQGPAETSIDEIRRDSQPNDNSK